MNIQIYRLAYVIFCCLIIVSCTNIKILKDYFVNQNVKISSEQTSRLINYLNSEFYSYDIKREVYAYPLAFLISEDGKKSIILACEGGANECSVNIEIFQLIQKYNKKENVKFRILALEKNIKIKNKELFNKLKNQKYSKIPKRENIYFDKILMPFGSCGDNDC